MRNAADLSHDLLTIGFTIVASLIWSFCLPICVAPFEPSVKLIPIAGQAPEGSYVPITHRGAE